jgi:HEAT repeat protein
MKKLLFLLAASSMLWVYQAEVNPASAHGGQYRGPVGEVPPGSRDPKDPQPPPEPPGSETPTDGPGTGTSGGGISTGDSPPDAPRPVGPAPSPVGPGPTSGTTTERSRVLPPPPMSYENWLFWWNYNKDEFLNLKAAIKALERKESTRTSVHAFGIGGTRNRSDTQAPTEREIEERIIPALLKVISCKDIHPDIRGGAIIALSRCGGGLAFVKNFFDLAKDGANEDRLVQESAILALGILQIRHPEIRDFLIGLVDNRDVWPRARCFAALSLGLLKDNSPETFAALERCIDGRESTPDVPVCALLSIGLIGDAKKVPDLISWYESGGYGRNRFSDLDKAYVISALGKIEDPAALEVIDSGLRRKGALARRSAWIALGQILPRAAADVQIDWMRKFPALLKSESDMTARNFGLISIGRIGGQDSASEPVRKAALAILLEQFDKGSKTMERPYAALALGILGFEGKADAPKPAALKYAIIDVLRKDLESMKGDKTALGANAIALGLVGERDAQTVKLLTSILADRGVEKKLRGSAAIALGLIGDSAACDAILTALEERQDRELRVETAVAAGLLGDSQAVKAIEKLVEILNDKKASQFVLGSVALALGQIGDRRAFDPMLEILKPEKVVGAYPDLTRALVAVALGQISDRSDYRVLYRISKDINYRASVPALEEILTIL